MSAAAEPPRQRPPGLVLSARESVRSFLSSASQDRRLPEDLRRVASDLSSLSEMPYRSLRDVWTSSDPSRRPDSYRLLHGSGFVFDSPNPRENSGELKARLTKLSEIAEKKGYEELVKDITQKKETVEPFSSYKDQLGFALHVVVTMFTGYLVGYFAFRALFSRNTVMSAAGGILGLVGTMLVETLLFIIRMSNQDVKRPSSSNSRLKKDQYVHKRLDLRSEAQVVCNTPKPRPGSIAISD